MPGFASRSLMIPFEVHLTMDSGSRFERRWEKNEIMELHQIRYFLAVANTLNFTRAAKQCNVTQPALTKAVQKLEQELGGILIHRERQLTQLTELGKTVLPMLEQALASVEAVVGQAQEYRRKEIAPLRIGVEPTISVALMMEPISEIARFIPGLRVELHEASAENLIGMLLEGEVNVALAGEIDDPPERIDHWPLFEERYVMIAAHHHPLAERNTISIDALHNAIILDRIGCDITLKFRKTCLMEDATLKFGHRSKHESHLQHMAAAGFGLVLAPAHAPRLPSLKAIPLEGDPVRREVSLLTVAGRRHSPALDAFVKIARLWDWTDNDGELRQ
jgi:DNA-binding transcriptional LysR family regulator